MSDEIPTGGCLAGHCDITGTRPGVHHNGGCNCLYGLDPEKRRALRRELARLRAEVERLTTRAELAEAAFARAVAEQGIIADDRDSALTSHELACEREGRLRVEVERLTRERDEWEAHAEHLGDVVGVYTARAETAERERDDARRALIRSCFGSAEYADIRKPGDPDGIRARSHEEAAQYWGWGYLYPSAGGKCPECPGEDGRHAMSCSRGGGKGQLVVPVTTVADPATCPGCGYQTLHAGGIGTFCPNKFCDRADDMRPEDERP